MGLLLQGRQNHRWSWQRWYRHQAHRLRSSHAEPSSCACHGDEKPDTSVSAWGRSESSSVIPLDRNPGSHRSWSALPLPLEDIPPALPLSKILIKSKLIIDKINNQQIFIYIKHEIPTHKKRQAYKPMCLYPDKLQYFPTVQRGKKG